MKLYLASPWFSEDQNEREIRVKSLLRRLGIEVFSPREASELEKDASEEDQRKVFEIDINSILNCDGIFAITNGKDMGTIFESGFAWANHKPIIYFAEGLRGPFNLMLAQSANLVYTSIDQFDYNQMYNAVMNNEITPYKGYIE